jgi:hypothetical protein
MKLNCGAGDMKRPAPVTDKSHGISTDVDLDLALVRRDALVEQCRNINAVFIGKVTNEIFRCSVEQVIAVDLLDVFGHRLLLMLFNRVPIGSCKKIVGFRHSAKPVQR